MMLNYYKPVKTAEDLTLSIDKVVIDYKLTGPPALDALCKFLDMLPIRMAVATKTWSCFRWATFRENCTIGFRDRNSFWIGVRHLRFMAGLRDLAIHHRIKLAIPLAYLMVLALELGRLPVSYDSVSDMVLWGCIKLALLLMGIIVFAELIIVLGTPRRASRIENNLIDAGFTNATRLPPLLLSVYKGAHKHSLVYEFDLNNIPPARWEKGKDKIGVALNVIITSIKQSRDGKRIILHTVPPRSAIPDKVYWKDEYLSRDDGFVLILGEGLLGRATVDLSETPHILLGGPLDRENLGY